MCVIFFDYVDDVDDGIGGGRKRRRR